MVIETADRVGVESNERVNKLREGMFRIPELCLERGYLITESYKETEDEPALIRRARAQEKILREMSIHIDDGELIVGRATSKRRGAPLLPEVSGEWYLREMDTLSTREWDKIAPLTEEEKVRMKVTDLFRENLRLRPVVQFMASGALPRFETKAEINLFKNYADVLSMTLANEMTLAKELDLEYAAICTIDNYCHGISNKKISLKKLKKYQEKNQIKIKKLIDAIINELK